MNSDELKKLLDEYAKLKFNLQGQTVFPSYNHSKSQGFQDAVQLLWPLVEALEEYANADDDSDSSPITHAARQALTDLKEKLKGG